MYTHYSSFYFDFLHHKVKPRQSIIYTSEGEKSVTILNWYTIAPHKNKEGIYRIFQLYKKGWFLEFLRAHRKGDKADMFNKSNF